MPTSYTTILNAQLQATGEDNNTWGTNLNTGVIQILEDAIAGTLSTAASAGALGAANTLDLTGTNPSSARWSNLIFTGAITANQTIKVPNATKWWMVNNQCTGSFTVTFKTASGSASTAIPANSGWQKVYCDGNNVITVAPFNFKQIQMPDGSAAAPAYSNVNEPTSGLYRSGAGDWRVSISGTDTVQITSLGINLPSPTGLYFNAVKFDPTATVPSGVETFYAGVVAPSGWLFCNGQSVSRSTYANLLAAISAVVTGASTHGNTTIDGYGTDLRNLGLEGATVEITGAASNVTVVSVAAGSITTSSAISGSASGLALRLLPYGSDWPTNTNFTVPDRRGRAIFGRDNMGGSAAGRITSTVSPGIIGAASPGVSGGNQLSAVGGEQTHVLLQAELASHTHTDTGHSHQFTYTLETFGYGTGGQPQPVLSVQTSGGGVSVTTQSGTASLATTGSNTAHNTLPPGGISNVIIKT